MDEDKEALTLWDFYRYDKENEGGFVIDDRPGADHYYTRKSIDEDLREWYIKSLPDEFVAGFDLSLLPPCDKQA